MKLDKEFFRLSATLTVVSVLVALLLGGVNALTADQIAENERRAVESAMLEVMPEAKQFVDYTDKLEAKETIRFVRRAMGDGNQALGHVVQVATSGFGGTMELIVGVTMEGTVTGVSIISHAETPGLGAKAGDAAFLTQYLEKDGSVQVVKGAAGDGEVSALTGATITSEAVTQAVREAVAAAAEAAYYPDRAVIVAVEGKQEGVQ